MMNALSNNRLLSMMVVVVLSVLLGACSSTPRVNKADQIKADEEHNIVFLGYDVIVGPMRLDTRATPNGTANFVCENLDTGDQRDCFTMPLRFGKTDNGNFLNVIGIYSHEAASPFKMKYGRYQLVSVEYRVVTDVDIRTTCETDSKGNTYCHDNYYDEYDNGRADILEDIVFSVKPGAGCYLGSALFEIQFNDLIDFSLTQRLPEDLDNVREGLSEAVQAHVTRSCLSDSSL